MQMQLATFACLLSLSAATDWSGILIDGGNYAQLYSPYSSPPDEGVVGRFGMNSRRHFSTVAMTGNGRYYYFFGGYGDGSYDSTFVFDALINRTNPGKPLPNGGAYGMCATAYNATTIILCGGISAGNQYLRNCYAFTDNLYTQIAPYPTPIAYCAMTMIGKELFSFGGRPADSQITGDVHYLDASFVWKKTESLKYETYNLGVASMSETLALVCGGQTYYTENSTECFIYDSVSRVYTETVALNYATGHEYLAPNFAGQIYAFHDRSTVIEVYDTNGWGVQENVVNAPVDAAVVLVNFKEQP